MLRAADGPALPGRVQPEMISRMAEAPSFARTLAGLRRYRHLLRNLVLKDLKLKYRGSVIGFLWSLANPVLMGVVYTIAFRSILQIRNENFVFYLMLGLLAWTFFASSVTMSTGSIADNGGLVKSVWFPRAILPIATVLFNFTQYILSVSVILPLMLIYYRVTPAAPMLLFPVFVALQVLFTIGIALSLATATAFLRDVRHLVEIAITILFWMTPVVYQLREVSEPLRRVLLLSPMSPYVTAYQQIFYYRQWPDAAIWITSIAYAAAALALGFWLIVRNEDRFAERV
ncbi:MAG: ABC transporter permease [Vicinamibacterales bacterium]